MTPVHRDICVYLNSMLICRYWTKQQILVKYINMKYIYMYPLFTIPKITSTSLESMEV